MKAITTLVFVLLIGFTAQAKDAQAVTFETGFVTAVQDVNATKETEVARLYRHKYSQVKRELNFTTKRNAVKLA